MTMMHCALIALAGVVLVAVAAQRSPRVRERLRARTIAALLGAAMLVSGASAVVAHERSAGTGTSTGRGWPKPFHFHWRSWESTEQHRGTSALYFLGNTAVYASVLALGWAGLSLRRRRLS